MNLTVPQMGAGELLSAFIVKLLVTCSGDVIEAAIHLYWL
jgi:hypothetical protein